MPELPDLEIYREALTRRFVGAPLVQIRLGSPFVLRSVKPPLDQVRGRSVVAIRRIGKRIVWDLEGEFFAVVHLMIAGRFHEKPLGAKLAQRGGLAAFDGERASVHLTEAGSQRRAWLRMVQGGEALRALDPGGVEPIGLSQSAFAVALTRENRTLKRALTDPRLFAGIGNSYSDEILHRARLSPFARTGELAVEKIARLHTAVDQTLTEATERIRREVGDSFPEKVTAFRPDMAVHGRFGLPCPVCGTAIQRVVYAQNEANYCPTCQTDGKLLADRALSQLLRGDWPKTLEELEERKRSLATSSPSAESG